MAHEKLTDARMIVVGVVGIVALLVGALGYALWDSGTHYETDQIHQFVLEQQSTETEQAR